MDFQYHLTIGRVQVRTREVHRKLCRATVPLLVSSEYTRNRYQTARDSNAQVKSFAQFSKSEFSLRTNDEQCDSQIYSRAYYANMPTFGESTPNLLAD